jgi:hypothetical protein
MPARTVTASSSHWLLVIGPDGTTCPLVSQTGSWHHHRGIASKLRSLSAGSGAAASAWDIDENASVMIFIGCGLKKPEGSIGIDMNAETTANIIHDLNRTLYPPQRQSIRKNYLP